MSIRTRTAQDLYRAFAAGDRDRVEQILSADFTFSAPPDPLLDRQGYFERCWPGAGTVRDFEFARVLELGEEVVVTYEATGPGGGRSRNTEILTFDGDRVCRAEVYFGWQVD
jgi:ketosteroid isomerase-like protein